MVTRPKLRLSRYLVPVIIVLAIIFSIRQCGNQEKPSGHPRDYAAIAKEGILRVATEYNSISFYVDGDTVSGFHYELIQAFAYDKGLKTEITPLMSFEERLEGLSEGRYDVIACGILATSELKDSLLLTSPITLNKQVLVQRRENGENDSLYIRNQLDLAGSEPGNFRSEIKHQAVVYPDVCKQTYFFFGGSQKFRTILRIHHFSGMNGKSNQCRA